jgi:hypothetical protein
MKDQIPEIQYELCIKCNLVKQAKMEITLEKSNLPFKTGCICESCFWLYRREDLISVIK